VDKQSPPVALFVFGAFRKQSGGLSRAWYQRLIAMDNQGWEIHLALFNYRRYRKRNLSIVLGGPLPKGIKIHRFWNKDEITFKKVLVLTGIILRNLVKRITLRPRKNVVREVEKDSIFEYHYDPIERLVLKVELSKDTEEVLSRVWFDFSGEWILKEWLGQGEDNPSKIQRRSDPIPLQADQARADWLISLDLPVGTVAMADSPYSYPAVAKLPNRFGRIFVFHLQHLTYGQDAMGKLTKRMQAYFDPVAMQADSVLVSTKEQAHDLRLRYGSDYKVDFIPPVVRSVENISNTRRDPRKVVSVGRLVDIKRLHHAVNAMKLVIEKVPDAYLEIWGSGPEFETISNHIIEKEMTSHVKLMGYTPNPEMVFKSAACSVLTSRREAFGLVVIESMLQGCPVVAFDVKYGPSGIIKNGVNGFLLADKDVAGVAEGIVKILTDAELQHSMTLEAEKIKEVVDRNTYEQNWNSLGLRIRDLALDRSS
jgi:glycosyltransferase involved in cell wall biosynthesis